MTDVPPPRIRSSRGAANPAPRQALPRVKPLGAGVAPPSAPARTEPVESAPATGRDLLIPNGSERARRKGRGTATVPTLAELMPPAEQRQGKKPHGQSAGSTQSAPARLNLTEHGHKAKGGKGAKEKPAPDEPVKEVELAIILSKGLRKRLKAKAAEIGLSPEAAVAQLVEVWVDG